MDSEAQLPGTIASQCERRLSDCGIRPTGQRVRIAVLLLVNALAMFLAWLAGHLARSKNLDRHFQSNGSRKRHSLSIVTVGWMVLADDAIRLARSELNEALRRLSEPPLPWDDPCVQQT